jgi:hypothetical protein
METFSRGFRSEMSEGTAISLGLQKYPTDADDVHIVRTSISSFRWLAKLADLVRRQQFSLFVNWRHGVNEHVDYAEYEDHDDALRQLQQWLEVEL